VRLGLYTLLDGSPPARVLQPNLSTIVTHVRRAPSISCCLKPRRQPVWLSARTFSPWRLPGVAAGLALIVVAAAPAGARPMGASVVAALVLVAQQAPWILYSLWFVAGGQPSIWFVKVWNATEVLARRPGGRPATRSAALSRGFAHVFHLLFLAGRGFPHKPLRLRRFSAVARLPGLPRLLAGWGFCLFGRRKFWQFALAAYTSGIELIRQAWVFKRLQFSWVRFETWLHSDPRCD